MGDEASRAGVGALSGTLVIVGGGKTPDEIRDRFLELAGGPKARVVVIPTASKRAKVDKIEALKSYAYWMPLEKARKVESVVFLHARSEEQANDPAFVKPLTEATAVWLGGGDQSLLTAAYKNTAVERELKRLLARGGVIGGTSAGAAVMSDRMIRYGNPVAAVGTGFGFLPGFVVDQHFEQRKRLARLLGVLVQYPKCLGLGIDERTAVVVNLRGRNMTVLGEEKVWVCLPSPGGRPAEVKPYRAGAQLDLATLDRTLTAEAPASHKDHKDDPAPAASTSSSTHGTGAR